MSSKTLSLSVLASLFIAASALLYAQETGQYVTKQGTVKEDLYLAGGTVDVLANVEGDVVVAGGQIDIENQVSGDVLAAGGNVHIRAKVGDDVRVVGGNVTISGAVADDTAAAGGQVTLAPNATIGGRAWFAGNTLRIEGKIGKQLRAAGNHIVIAGEIAGDAQLAGESIEIQPNAVIRGNLTYYSRNEAKIDSGAKIGGTVVRQQLREEDKGGKSVGAAFRAGVYLSFMLTGIVFYLLFPTASVEAARTIARSPWKSLALGLAFLAAVPFAIVLLFLTVFGTWLALTLLAVYLVLLLPGFLTGVLFLGDWGLRQSKRRGEATNAWRIVSIVAALVVLWIVRLIPVVGGLVVFVLLLFGLGALSLYLWRRYETTR